jgi:nitrous oxidase accessory protein
VVIWFSNGTTVRRNVVTDSRYGLHYMYSNDNVFVGNRFEANEVGAFIMYSRRITFRENVFASARGPSGRGLGFKDSEGILAEDNVLVKNAVGISLDNSPNSDDVVNLFRRNVIAYNDVAVLLLPSVHSNVFTANEFVDNVIPLRVSGGGHGRANQWHGNYWSEYAGFDADGDGVGDRPFVFQRLSDDVLARHEALQLFALSPAVNALNTVSGVLPGLQPEPLLIDSAPRRSRWAAAVESPRGRGAGPVSLGLFGLATGALVVVARSRRSRSAS